MNRGEMNFAGKENQYFSQNSQYTHLICGIKGDFNNPSKTLFNYSEVFLSRRAFFQVKTLKPKTKNKHFSPKQFGRKEPYSPMPVSIHPTRELSGDLDFPEG